MHRIAMLFAVLLAAGHCFAEDQRPNEGVVRGEVLTTGEDRVVVVREEGGQATLEVGWKKVEGNKWVRADEQIQLIRTLKKGDKIAARWRLGETGHLIIQEMVKLGPDGKPLPREGDQARETPKEGEPLARELHSLRGEVASLKAQVAELKELVRKALEAK
ncbi:MAG: hypothetical protein GW911_30905 [Armatimonadetes bacterium]|nr:hypothetical protein [Armatimonadota bacterium]PIU95288.1 MAG: hypothetical protein COS65_03295 [Armatimonadetes bacterium CG06_land_8_20_14_3_00_66_21]NCO95080.1 hypothetical protein [Armatimonadota bacterium]NCP33757.1 hypothetical protein [Armatimonadota bacterium]NCQ28467.1 hypothetical protein [Armatimonadota bacterium]